MVLGLWAGGPSAARALAAGRSGSGHLALLRGRPAAGRTALAAIHAAGASSFPRSSPAMVPGSCDTGSARPHDADREDAAIFAPFLLRSRRASRSFIWGLCICRPEYEADRCPYFPKEFVIALLFAAASALPAWDEARRRAAGMPRHHPLLLLCPLFAVLCWLNCVAIEDWEQHRQGGRIRWLCRCWPLRPVASVLPDLANHPARWLAIAAVFSAVPIPAARPVAAGGWRTAHRSRSRSADTPAHLLLPVMERLHGMNTRCQIRSPGPRISLDGIL